jgi:hypothetical protein
MIGSQSRLNLTLTGMLTRLKSERWKGNIFPKINWVSFQDQRRSLTYMGKYWHGIFRVSCSPPEWCALQLHSECLVLANFYDQNEFNRVMKSLKPVLSKPVTGKAASSWRSKNFIFDQTEAIYGAGRISLSVGHFVIGQSVCICPVYV